MKYFTFLTVLFLFSFMNVYANERGNGGDPCEKRIIRIKTDLKDWINSAPLENLTFPVGVDSESYKKNMLFNIEKARVFCTEKDVFVGASSKTCVNSKNIEDIIDFLPRGISSVERQRLITEKKPTIICNVDRFKESSIDEQYVLIHHEYAGLSEIETNNQSEESNYFISNQISAYLEEKTVVQLSIVSLKDRFIPICKRSEGFKAELERILGLHCSAITWRDINNIYKLKLGLFNLVTAEYNIERLQLHKNDLQGFFNLEELSFDLINIETLPRNFFKHAKKLKKLVIPVNLNMFNLNKDTFLNLKKLRSLNITIVNNPRKIRMPSNLFTHLGNLHELKYNSSQSFNFNSSLFKNLKKLRSMTLDSVNMSNISKELLLNKKKLKTLRISSTPLEKLKPYQFSSLPALTKIMIDWHNIKEIPAFTFAGLDRIQEIDLSYGDIQELNLNSFSKMNIGATRQFLSVNLRRNKLTDFDPKIFTSVNSLSLLTLEENNITSRVQNALRRYSPLGSLTDNLK